MTSNLTAVTVPNNNFHYDFAIRTFTFNGEQFRASITPELFNEGDSLDFTGKFMVLLIGEQLGTRYLELVPGDNDDYIREPEYDDKGNAIPEIKNNLTEYWSGIYAELSRIIIELKYFS